MSQCKTLIRICPTPRATPSLLPLIQSRHESTTRRHKKLLHVQQAPSYTPSARIATLIFNPPSSAPSVYHTPLKFLPKDDKRRALYASFQQSATQSALAQRHSPIAEPGTPLSAASALPPRPSATLPPPVRASYDKKYHLGDADVAEIRRLRLEDPDKWTRVRLAERFGCSQFFVGMVVKVPEKAERVREEQDRVRARWGRVRREAREDRGRRRVLWGRDL